MNTIGGATPVGLQFDEIGAFPGSLTIAGNTLGTTTFTGFGAVGSFYVRIEDGTLLDTVTGDPIIIDGLNATFDGINPISTGGILSAADLAFIEDRLFDADDALVDGRGQIFVGTIAAVDQEDVFRQFGFNPADLAGLDVTILGLPNIPGGPVGFTPSALNNLLLRLLVVMVLLSPEDLNAIEAAAGGEGSEAASCWNDALGAADSGQITNLSYGGGAEALLDSEASCGS